MEYVCVSMILQLKNDLIDSELDMCLAYFFSYKEPESLEYILKYALKVKEKFRDPNYS